MITDLASLQAQVIDHLARPDLEGVVPTLIQLAEQRLLDDIRIRQWYPELEKLSDTVAVNDLLTDAPSLYLFSTLVESAPYLKDDTRAAVWADMLAAGIGALHKRKWTEDFEAQECLIPSRTSIGA